MMQGLLGGDFERIELIHVRLAFSKEIGEIGRPTVRKIAVLVSTVLRIVIARYRSGAQALLYPPAGPDRTPVYRDIVILLLTRRLFRNVIFYFHASGVSTLYPSLSPLMKPLFRAAYHGAEAAIRTSELNPDDPGALNARRSYVVPCGVSDPYSESWRRPRTATSTVSLLYVGVLMESKGILVLLDACSILQRRSIRFDLNLVGAMYSAAFSSRVEKKIADEGLATHVRLSGVRTGQEKLDAYLAADIFCYPSYFESESFGVVLLEAMQHAVPVVATRWRGIPSVVQDERTGLLVNPRDAAALASAIERLIADAEQAEEMGRRGRQRFLEHFTLTGHQRAMERVICSVVDGANLQLSDVSGRRTPP
jgi:glycosyltransferase involved in cell wall biosynthesis